MEQSLVVAEPGRTTQYWMLETLREYAAERLVESGEQPDVAARHARYYAGVVAEVTAQLRGPSQREALQELRTVHPNLRAALAWLSGPGEQPDEALRVAGSLGRFWHHGPAAPRRRRRGTPGAGSPRRRQPGRSIGAAPPSAKEGGSLTPGDVLAAQADGSFTAVVTRDSAAR